MMIPSEIMNFYLALSEMHNNFTGDITPLKLTLRQKLDSLNNKAPLLSFVDFQPDREQVRQSFQEVCRIVKEHRPQVKEELAGIEKELDVPGNDIACLAEKFFWQDNRYLAEFCESRQINRELLLLVLFNTVKPFINGYARRLKDQFEAKLWHQNFCPVCGWKPTLAVNTAENSGRLLQCPMCETTWPFKSLKCPHCLNEDHDTLNYFTVEDDEIYQVNGCKKCGGYIKTVNEGKMVTKENAFLTDIKTIYLDILAEREGYIKGKAGN